ncbi:N-acetylmuramoyl-L-alanine amidase [bacterium]|nr:N-acetylmuramoyl-L-alanine amidase [bacterium]
MRKTWKISFALLFCGLFFATFPLQADEDLADYQIAKHLGYKVFEKSFGRFETPVFLLEPKLNNLLISLNVEKTMGSVVRSYARFRYKKTGRWTRYKNFEGECHFSDISDISAYQMLFVILDFNKGKTLIEGFTAQGKKLSEEAMKAFVQNTIPLDSSKTWPKPSILSREEWKARPPKGEYTLHDPRKIILHHSYVPTQSQYSGASTIRGIQNYHMDNQATGWMDIGYHFLIGPDGTIFRGRPEAVIGSHCLPNSTMIGICLIGNYDPNADKLNEKIERSLINLLSWLSSTYHIDPRLYYYGHRNFSPKSCPGDIAYDRLPFYREEVWRNIGETGY